ncbi:DNA-binding IclR family transcriptional regulator [Pseudarthrobacter defluvii]|uniref:IclR family transcriptional regulator n=1 Tax=Pseudarthrobacter defluvii TaxID=410837 RepID=UPI00278355DD|nr:IclR family transcriptional regulator [Pseudarthrobacter defluvii]MDQ0769482.1 DNA-binding IclR family transcriptional regulator [Pseudarthrobacter defluvii]
MAEENSGNSAGSRRTVASKVPSAHNTLRILQLLAAKKAPIPASRIADELGLPRSSIYDLLGVMEAQGFVTHLPSQGRYGLGVDAREVSSAYSQDEPLSRVGRPLLARLAQATGKSAHLSVLHGRDIRYLFEEPAKSQPSFISAVGMRLPSHLTATGRAILAAAPRAHVRALYPNAAAFAAPQQGSLPITKYQTLSSELNLVSQRGYAAEYGRTIPGFGSIAVAVKDQHGWPTAAIAVTYVEEDFPVPLQQALADTIKKTAFELSRRIHGPWPTLVAS